MKPSEISSPEEMVGSIDDLLKEFFLRIPLKPLFRLKLVSKHWNSLISDPKLHSSRHKKAVGFIFHSQNPTDEYLGRYKPYLMSLDRSSPLGPPMPSITEMYISKRYKVENKIFHSCNGLLVGYLFKYSKEDYRDKNIKDYFVYNPTTGEYFSIPSRRRGLGSIKWMYLAFDPSNSPHYNIVCVLASSRNWKTKHRQYSFAVFSSKTRSWKIYDNKFSSESKFKNGVYWNGSIHWISSSMTEKSIYFTPDDEENDVVVDPECDGEDEYCYSDDDVDCGRHQCTVFEMPTPLLDESKIYFGESCDHLNFISYFRRGDYKLKVYEMRRDYSEWFVKYSVDVSNVRCPVWDGEGYESLGCPKAFDLCGLVRSKKEDGEDDSFLVLLIKRRVVVYNVVNGTFEIVSEFDENEEEKREEFFKGYDIFRNLRFSSKFDYPLPYIESLCSV